MIVWWNGDDIISVGETASMRGVAVGVGAVGTIHVDAAGAIGVGAFGTIEGGFLVVGSIAGVEATGEIAELFSERHDGVPREAQ